MPKQHRRTTAGMRQPSGRSINSKPLSAAMRACALSLGLTFSIVPMTTAQAQEQVAEQKSYNIPSGPLGQSLNRFASEAGITLSFEPRLVQGQQAPALNGNFTPLQGLEALLAGSELMAVTHAGGYKLKLVSAETHILDPITVYGRQKNDTVEAIPQTVNVYTQDDFENTSADTVGDILRLTPNATKALGSSLDMFADDYLIRGFDAEQSTNGLGFRQTDHPMDLANVERIEVLKGPSSVLYGQMEPGGTINVVTKQPLAYNYADASVENGSHDYKRATLDVTGPINDKVRARLNLAYQDIESFVDFWEYRRLFVAPNVTMDLTDTTNLTVEGSYSQNQWTAMPGGAPIEGAFADNPNGKYDKSFNPAFRDSFTDRDSHYVNARLTQAVTDTIDARLSYSFTRNDADFSEYAPFGLDGDLRTLNRIIFASEGSYKKDHDVILDLTGEVVTGVLTHKFLAGVNYRKSDVFRPTQLFFTDSIDLFDPQYSPAVLTEANQFRNRTLHQDDEILAGFVQDRITVADRWHLLAGLRYTDSEQSQKMVDHRDGDSVSEDELNETNWSTQAGLVFDLTDSASLFASRTESFVPQGGTTSGGKPHDAAEGTQYEAGIRFEVGNLEVNASGFVIENEHVVIEKKIGIDGDGDPVFGEFAQGEQRSKGAELAIQGYVTPDWFLAASYGYTDTKIVRTDENDDGVQELKGNRFANVPLHTAALRNRYLIRGVPGLSVGGIITYVGTRPGDDENSFTLPGYTRVDLATYYALTDALQVDLLVNNVLDDEIYSLGSFSGVVRETDRTYQASLKYFF